VEATSEVGFGVEGGSSSDNGVGFGTQHRMSRRDGGLEGDWSCGGWVY